VRTAGERRWVSERARSAPSTCSATTRYRRCSTPPAIGIHPFRVDYSSDTSYISGVLLVGDVTGAGGRPN
jgi:hypothetical protein